MDVAQIGKKSKESEVWIYAKMQGIIANIFEHTIQLIFSKNVLINKTG